MPFGPARQTEEGWECVAPGWSPQAVRKVGDLPSPRLALLKELRRRTGPKWWDIYLPRIEKTARIVREAPSYETTRKVITERDCKATCVSRTQAYKDLDTARELCFLPDSRPLQ
ncbi:hypothetical protein OG444_38935 [Streptomyces sp. NBC_01232]|uniref:hypothetical protein n=1 Tax=Streptomyces sp. NBC_01232 TaxID=2903786 RepID=UPI002E0DFCB8|nr:hypothetical protein OG444_38935 [Streptomyces sp. NBC_01232]